jgi:hypothetical protein
LKLYPFARLACPALATVRWFSIMIAGAAVPVLLVLLLWMPRASRFAAATGAEPARSLPLTLAGDGGRLSLAWDRKAPAIRAGQCGVLWINDGGIHRRVVLDVSQLRAGKLFYWPVNKDVSFEIQMSEGDDGSGETVCASNAAALSQPAESAVRLERPGKRSASRNRRNKVHVAGRQSKESPQPEDGNGSGERNSPAFAVEGESQLVAILPVDAVRRSEASERQIRSAGIRPVTQGALEPYSTVTVEAVEVPESRMSRIAGKIPLLRRLHRTPDFQPPTAVRETTPAVPAELRRTLKSDVPLDVRAYIDESGKVTYAEMLSNVAEADRGLASMAVFNARRWEFKPAQQGGHVVPGQVILHYRFGNPLLAVSRDQR